MPIEVTVPDRAGLDAAVALAPDVHLRGRADEPLAAAEVEQEAVRGRVAGLEERKEPRRRRVALERKDLARDDLKQLAETELFFGLGHEVRILALLVVALAEKKRFFFFFFFFFFLKRQGHSN
jgi:hypothetical protein